MSHKGASSRITSWPPRQADKAPSARAGTTLIELLIAFTLLSTTLSVAVPLVVRHGRLLAEARHYRLALEEVSNQLDRLAALPARELPAELAQLAPSDFADARLPDAKLTGELSRADDGQRLTLTLAWAEGAERTTQVELATWISRDQAPATDDEAEESP